MTKFVPSLIALILAPMRVCKLIPCASMGENSLEK